MHAIRTQLAGGGGGVTALLTIFWPNTALVNVVTLLPLANRPTTLLLLTFELYTTLVRTGTYLLAQLILAGPQFSFLTLCTFDCCSVKFDFTWNMLFLSPVVLLPNL